jgi:hypothetical protein
MSKLKNTIRKVLVEIDKQKIIDDILDKISEYGIESLTDKEKKILDNADDEDLVARLSNEIKINNINFKVSNIKPEVFGEELRVWCNLEFLDKNLYGYLSGYPYQIGGNGFDSYVFTLNNDLYYGIEVPKISLDDNLSTYLEDELNIETNIFGDGPEHDTLYNFFKDIWEDVWKEFYTKKQTLDWFKKRGEEY